MLNVINLVLGGALLLAGRKLFWLFVGAAGFVTGIQLATRFSQGPDWLAIVIGLIIGVVEALAGFYLPEGFKDVAAYVVVLIVLLVWPSGIFGETIRKKV